MVDEEYREIEEDMIQEATKFGKIVSIKIPKPTKYNEYPIGSGNVYIEFDNVNETRMARKV